MRKYDSYKDSGVEWIGEIPSHWEVKKIKHHSVVNVGLVINPSTHFDDNGTVPILTGKNVKVSGIDLEDVDFITEESNELLWKTKIYEGDLVSMRVGYPGRTSIVTMKEDGINCCSVIITRKSNTMNSKLLVFQVNSKIGKVQVELCQGGMGQQVVNLGDWNEFRVITPPLSEQQQIVSFLDTKTSLIDSLIKKTQQKIELLKEKRTSLINHTVTKGLNPNVEMKDSGVEWIGEIPSHWEIKKIKHLFEHTKGRNGQKLTKEFIGENEGEYPVYSGSTKGNGELGRVNEYEFDTEEESVIFVSTVGSDTTVMSTRILSGKFNLSQNCLVMSKRKELDIMFVYFFTLTDFPYQRSLLPIILKEGHRSVGMGELDEFKVVFPPFSEQRQIVEYLDEHTQLIDKTISVEKRRIDTLKEYRQSLISEVVTGKIDVCQDNGIPWFQKPVPKVTIHKFETPINGREGIINTEKPIWGEKVYDIVLDNLEIVNSLFTSDLQFELISKYLIPVGTNPDDCYLLLKDNMISGILYYSSNINYRNDDYGYEPKGALFEIVNSEIEISIIEKDSHWIFDDLMKKGFSSFLLYYEKSYGKSSDYILTFMEIKEKLSNG